MTWATSPDQDVVARVLESDDAPDVATVAAIGNFWSQQSNLRVYPPDRAYQRLVDPEALRMLVEAANRSKAKGGIRYQNLLRYMFSYVKGQHDRGLHPAVEVELNDVVAKHLKGSGKARIGLRVQAIHSGPGISQEGVTALLRLSNRAVLTSLLDCDKLSPEERKLCFEKLAKTTNGRQRLRFYLPEATEVLLFSPPCRYGEIIDQVVVSYLLETAIHKDEAKRQSAAKAIDSLVSAASKNLDRLAPNMTWRTIANLTLLATSRDHIEEANQMLALVKTIDPEWPTLVPTSSCKDPETMWKYISTLCAWAEDQLESPATPGHHVDEWLCALYSVTRVEARDRLHIDSRIPELHERFARCGRLATKRLLSAETLSPHEVSRLHDRRNTVATLQIVMRRAGHNSEAEQLRDLMLDLCADADIDYSKSVKAARFSLARFDDVY